MTTPTPTPALTSTDIRAMRQADGFVVDLDGTHARLTLIKRARRQRTGPFEAEIADAYYPVMADAGSREQASFCRVYANGAFAALAALVRPGDRLIFTATPNNNGYLDAARIPAGVLDGYGSGGYDALYHDVLYVTIIRPTKTGRNRERTIVRDLMLDESTCPGNTARAIRPMTFSLEAR